MARAHVSIAHLGHQFVRAHAHWSQLIDAEKCDCELGLITARKTIPQWLGDVESPKEAVYRICLSKSWWDSQRRHMYIYAFFPKVLTFYQSFYASSPATDPSMALVGMRGPLGSDMSSINTLGP